MSRTDTKSITGALCDLSLKPSTPPPTTSFEQNSTHTINFATHVRTQFRKSPTDRTGDLVRLLEDISIVSHSISSYLVNYHSRTDSQASSSQVALRQLYTSLSHDGYACLILERSQDAPLTFGESALNGGYVVMLTALDSDPNTDSLCATAFSIYQRRSPISLPGRLRDLQQKLKDQVAAGYIMYASATTLHYSIGNGMFSFGLHPVARRYFLFDDHARKIHEGTSLFAPFDQMKNSKIGQAALCFARESHVKCFDSGSLFANFHSTVLEGGILVWPEAHLLCDAAPLAYLAEQMGGKATDGSGNRILDMAVEDENVHRKINICIGSPTLVDAVEVKLSNPGPS